MPSRPTTRDAPLPGDQFADACETDAATRLAFARGPLWIRALMRARHVLGRRCLALAMPFHRVIAVRMIEGVVA